MDTIFALSTGKLPSGVAIIRISGPRSRFACETLLGHVPPARLAVLRDISGSDGRRLDKGVVLHFPGPDSFTGEDCLELHVHGGKAVVAALLRELSLLEGLRHAEAGEFTRRAFMSGKLDLTAVEALSDLINAETETQRRLALGNAAGAQRALYESWRKRLLYCRAMIEAELDFSDQDDVPRSASDVVWPELAEFRATMLGHVSGFSRAEMIRDGANVVLLGAPNAGKSSLLNALARREVAIVSDQPGTTRDLIEVSLDLDGFKVVLVDTAGIRPDPEHVEAIGIERALDRASNAHLIVSLEDLADPVPIEFDAGVTPVLRIGTKADLSTRREGQYDLCLSAKSGEGIEGLLDHLVQVVGDAGVAAAETVPSRSRHVQQIELCVEHLTEAFHRSNLGLELRSEHIRLAADSLARITGSTGVEEMLGVIFSEFCIGK